MRKKAFALALATALTLGSAIPVLATYDNGTQAFDDEGYDFDDEEGDIEDDVNYYSPEITSLTPQGGDDLSPTDPYSDVSLSPSISPQGGDDLSPTDPYTDVTTPSISTPVTRTTITPRATTPPSTTSPKTGQVDYLLFGTLGAAACASVVVVGKKKNDKK